MKLNKKTDTNSDTLKELNWKINEYIGLEVYKLDKQNKIIEIPLTNYFDLQAGTEIAIPICNKMSVKKDSYGILYAENQELLCALEFAEDDRHCWISGGLINKRALQHLTIFNT